MNKIFFLNADRNPEVRSKEIIKRLVNVLITQEGLVLKRINYVFCSDSYLFHLNKKYLQHTTLTDVITFPLSDVNNEIEAEVYISIDRIKENSESLKEAFDDELFRVIIHGALHLCGYNDKTVKEKKLMRKHEDFYLNQYNVSREAKQ